MNNRCVRDREVPRLTAVTGLLLLFLAAPGCTLSIVPPLKLNADVEKPPRTVILFFVDGLDYRRLSDMMNRGELPHLRTRFREGGVEVATALTSIPALTYPNSTSLMTGCFPGHHGIIGNQWLDRKTLFHTDYITASTYLSVNKDFSCPTIYEALSDQFTVDVQEPVNRGATSFIDNQTQVGPAWFVGLFESIDQRAAGSITDVSWLANEKKRWPSLIVHYFPGVDEIGHQFGSDSWRYRNALRNVDAQVGRVIAALERAKLADTSCFVLVSDHGHLPVSSRKSLKLVDWVKQRTSLRVHTGLVSGRDEAARVRLLEPFNAVAIDGSARRLLLYLKSGPNWALPPSPPQTYAVLSRLMKDGRLDAPKGLGLVCALDPMSGVRVVSRLGSARIERRVDAGARQYRMTVDGRHDGAGGDAMDPLGYGESMELRMFVDAGWHESREWLTATLKQPYPDFVPQIVELFDSNRTGEVVFFAEEDWVFEAATPGEHGSALAADMQIPMFFAGADLAKGAKIDCARIVDVMPTIIEIIAGPKRASETQSLDGVSLWPQLRAVGRP